MDALQSIITRLRILVVLLLLLAAGFAGPVQGADPTTCADTTRYGVKYDGPRGPRVQVASELGNLACQEIGAVQGTTSSSFTPSSSSSSTTSPPPPPVSCPPDCPAPPPPRTPPAFPKPAKPGLAEYLSNRSEPLPASIHDADEDGYLDYWDAVNLPSEAQTFSTAQDTLSLVDGLPSAGFLLLVEPRHQEAYLAAVDPENVNDLLRPTPLLTASQALDRIEALQGRTVRNTMAMVLHDAMQIHYAPLQPEVPQDIPLQWTTPVPTDGSWLLVQVDPTSLVEMTLGGQSVQLAARAASHVDLTKVEYRWQFLNVHQGDSFCYDSATSSTVSPCQGNHWPGWIRAFSGQANNALEATWQALEQQVIPLTSTPPNPLDDPAALALPIGELVSNVAPTTTAGPPPLISTGIVSSLPPDLQLPSPATESLTIPESANCLSTGCTISPCNDIPACQESAQAASIPVWGPSANEAGIMPFASEGPVTPFSNLEACGLACSTTCGSCQDGGALPNVSALVEPSDALRLFSQDAPWNLLGNASRPLAPGVGVDYLVDASVANVAASKVFQVEKSTLDGTNGIILEESPRQFLFQGAYYSTPATPRNLNRIALGITDVDGNSAGQAFLIDGKRITELLDLQPGDELVVDIDEAHRAGFESLIRDLTGDGLADAVVYVPHFSAAWLTLANSNTNIQWWDVQMTSPTTGWLSGANGAVYRYATGQLDRYDIRNSDGSQSVTAQQRTLGLHVISDTQFYVAVGPECNDAESDTPPVIAYYTSGVLAKNAFTLMPGMTGLGCGETLYDVWMSGSPGGQTFGYAGGNYGRWFKYTGGAWLRQTFGDFATSYEAPGGTTIQFRATSSSGKTDLSDCYRWIPPAGGSASVVACSPPPAPAGFDATFSRARGSRWWQEVDIAAVGETMSQLHMRINGGAWNSMTKLAGPSNQWTSTIELDAVGVGFVGVRDCNSREDPASAILHFDGKRFADAATEAVGGVYGIEGTDGDWAVGTPCSSSGNANGIYQKVNGTWRPTAETSAGSFFGVGKAGETDSLWFAGYDYGQGCAGSLLNRAGGVWTPYPLPCSTPALYDVDFASSTTGLAVGSYGTVLQFENEEAAMPTITGTVSPLVGDTATTFKATGGGSSPDGQPVRHLWSWGDGDYSYTELASHRYNELGGFTIAHYAYVNGRWQVFQTWQITIDPETATLDQTKSGVFVSSSSSSDMARWYRYEAAAMDRYVQVRLNSGSEAWALSGWDLYANGLVDWAPWPDDEIAASSYPGTSATGAMYGRIPAGKALDIGVHCVSKYCGTIGSGTTFALTTTVLTPLPTPSTTLQDGTYGYISPEFTVTKPANVPTRLTIAWGDGSTSTVPSEGFAQASTAWINPRSYATPGAYTVTVTMEDASGQQSLPVSRNIAVHFQPRGTAQMPTGINAVQATLTGTVTDLGGASTVSARYKIWVYGSYQFSPTYALSAPGPVPSWTVTGLTNGNQYISQLLLNNDVGDDWSWQSFQTPAPLTMVPQLVNNPSVNLGSPSSVILKASASHTQNVAYWVTWAPGTDPVRYPTTGYVPWNQGVTASRTFAFTGSYAASVRIEDALLASSQSTTFTATVNGASPVTSFTYSATLTSATLSAVGGTFAASPVQLRFGLQDKSTGTWSYNSYATITPGQALTWLVSLDSAKTYMARVELTGPLAGDTWATPTASMLTVRVNQPPMLLKGPTTGTASYLDSVRFEVGYKDIEGDPPRDSAGNLASPKMTLNGMTYDMYAASATPDFKKGTYYYYNVPAGTLPQGQMYTPSFQVDDQYQRSATSMGYGTFVAKAVNSYFDFEADPVNGQPNGMTRSSESLNYWHVTDTESSAMPQRIAAGHHGKALWFGNAVRGTYDDPRGGVPRGNVTLPWVSLTFAQAGDATLTFSSYYETEDLGTGKDQKRVEYRVFGGSWQSVPISGYEGGFGAWRTQRIDLPRAYVQVRFVFDAKDTVANGYLGWLIDDIVIGHDHDGDKLSDELERRRNDVQVTPNPVTVQVPDGGTATGWVRRLDRPLASTLALHAMVSSPAPSQLRVTLGARDSATGQEVSTVIHDGSPTGNCAAAPAGFIGAPTGGAVHVKSDGLQIQVNALSCGLNVPDRTDWFLTVTDKLSGDNLAYIDSLRAVSVGKTKFTERDTDYDEVDDGTEVDLINDPLGIDVDRDGVPSVVDADDAVPSWAPAIQLSSEDFRNRVKLAFFDTMAPLTSVRVAGKVNATGQEQAYSLNRDVEGWSFEPGQFGALPDVLRVSWRDAYGNSGALAVDMVQGASYQPKRTQLHVTDWATGISADFQQSLPGDGSPIRTLVVGGNTLPGNVYVTGAAIAATLLLAGVVNEFSGVQRSQVTVETAVQTFTYVTQPTLGAGHRSYCRNDDCIRYTTGQLAAFATGTLTAVEIENAIRNHQYRFPEAGGGTRYIWDTGTALVVIITAIENGGDEVLVKPWKWVLPSTFEWATQPTVEHFLLIEQTLQQKWANTMYQAAEDSLLLFRYLKTFDCAVPMNVEITSMSPGLSIGRELRIVVPKCVHDAWVYALKSMEDATKYAVNQGYIDTSIGMAMFSHLKGKAKIDQFRGEFYWYWDETEDSQRKADCSLPSSTWVHPYVRRCNPYEQQAFLEIVDWRTMSVPEGYTDTYIDVPDYLAMTEIDWAPSSDPYYTDAFSSKGAVIGFQSIISGSQDYWDMVFQEMADEIPSPALAEADADVRASYFITDLTGSQGFVDYRRVPT